MVRRLLQSISTPYNKTNHFTYNAEGALMIVNQRVLEIQHHGTPYDFHIHRTPVGVLLSDIILRVGKGQERAIPE